MIDFSEASVAFSVIMCEKNKCRPHPYMIFSLFFFLPYICLLSIKSDLLRSSSSQKVKNICYSRKLWS